MVKAQKAVKCVFIIAGLSATAELVFGFSGTMITVFGIDARLILFSATFISAYLFCILYLINNHIPLLRPKDNKLSLLQQLNLLDFTVLLLFISTLISTFIVPRLTGGSTSLAVKEVVGAFSLLTLYFPIRFMITWEQINFEKCINIFSYLLVGLSSIHIIMYVGLWFDIAFIDKCFAVWNSVFHGYTPGIILGNGGYPRVMFGTSYLIPVGIFLILRKMPKLRWYDYVFLAIHTTAILATMTRSIWYGSISGFLLFMTAYVIIQIRSKSYKKLIETVKVVGGLIILVILLNHAVFSGMITVRLQNSFQISTTPATSVSSYSSASQPSAQSDTELQAIEGNSSSVPAAGSPQSVNSSTSSPAAVTPSDYYSKMDQEGAAISNNIKLEQVKKLLNKWEKSPFFGFGYGSYVENYLRSAVAVYSYEMTAPALLMKIGIAGIFIWILFLAAMFINLLNSNGKSHSLKIAAWLSVFISFFLSLQTNPILFSYTGMSVVLLLALSTYDHSGLTETISATVQRISSGFKKSH